MRRTVGGYAGQILHVDLTHRRCRAERWSADDMRLYIGGAGLGASILYRAVARAWPSKIGGEDPGSPLVLATGPWPVFPRGTGALSVATVGAGTNGPTSSSLVGKDTSQTQDALASQLGLNGHALSVYWIGRRVNSSFGSRWLKAVAIVRGSRALHVATGPLPGVERPSARYGSTPTDGPAKGVGVAEDRDRMVARWYSAVGDDPKTGKPLAKTLRALGLHAVAEDLWG